MQLLAYPRTKRHPYVCDVRHMWARFRHNPARDWVKDEKQGRGDVKDFLAHSRGAYEVAEFPGTPVTPRLVTVAGKVRAS